jgi:hypothetical protein
MTTDWWSTQPATGEGIKESIAPPIAALPQPSQPPVNPTREEPDSDKPDAPTSGNSRGRVVKVVGGVAGAVIVGSLFLNAATDGSEQEGKSPATTSTSQSADLPPAGGGVSGEDLPAAGEGPAQSPSRATPPPGQPTAKVVTLSATPAGKGQVGVVMKVTIRNSTDEQVTVLATMVKGDGRPAIVGEGTLAPGLRAIEPGEVVEGTVEFSTKTAPHQVALLDLSGDLVAVSDEG